MLKNGPRASPRHAGQRGRKPGELRQIPGIGLALRHLGKAALGLALGLLLQACASAPPSAEALAANDPYEQTNRQTLVLNGKIDRYIVVPTVAVYFVLVPNGGRRGVHNFLGNLTKPAPLVDDLLQGEVTRGSQTLARFLINSTLGFGGFFDPATK